MDNYTVVICHGSYHTPIPYEPLIAALHEKGIDAYCPQLATSDLQKFNVFPDNASTGTEPDFNRPPPAKGYPQVPDDAVIIYELLDKLIEREGKNVILLGHSSGGFLATYVARSKYQRKVRQANNLDGGLIGIFYFCAFMVPIGESIHGFIQPKDGSDPTVPPYARIHVNGSEGMSSTVNSAHYFFNGLPEDTAKYYESTMTVTPFLTTVLDNDAYVELPCAYLITESDLSLPAAFQESMVAIQAQRAEVRLAVYRCDTGHSPQLTWTNGLVECIQSWASGII